MVAYEYDGLDDFTALFQSAKAVKDNELKESETDRFLKILEEIEKKYQVSEQSANLPCNKERIEHYIVVDPRGNIINEISAEERRNLVKKTHTMADLPKETEFEMIFGKQPEPKDMFEVKTDLRLKDGKEFHRLQLQDVPGTLFQWHGIRFEVIMMLASIIGLCLFAYMKFRKISSMLRSRRKQTHSHPKHSNETDKEELQRIIRQTIRQELAMEESMDQKPRALNRTPQKRKIYAVDFV